MAKFLNGKKTYIVAASMLLILGALLFLGKLTPELGFEVLVFAAPCFAATYRDALQRHHTEVTELLMDIVDAGVAVHTHNYAALESVGAKAANTIVTLTPGAPGPAGPHGPVGPSGPAGPQGPVIRTTMSISS